MHRSDNATGVDLYLPQGPTPDARSIERWFGNVALELAAGWHAGAGRQCFEEYYLEAGLLRAWRRPFFMRHYAETLAQAARHLLAGRPRPRILDLGCGTGSQSILFALLGAEVVAVDLDQVALSVMRSRLARYQSMAGGPLEVRILEQNTFEVDYRALGPFDGVYSLFAFNMMQPSQRLLDRLAPHCAPGARWAVLDGNRESIWNRIIPGRRRRVWSAAEMKRALEGAGFRVTSQTGGVALPPPLWALLPWRWALGLDRALCGGSFWPISVQTLAIRGTEGGS